MADAYYAAAKFARSLLAHDHHLVTRVRSNAVAYFPPSRRASRHGRGRPRLYGHKTRLQDWVRFRKQFTKVLSPVYGEADITLRYDSYDLLWRPLGQLVRFVWATAFTGRRDKGSMSSQARPIGPRISARRCV